MKLADMEVKWKDLSLLNTEVLPTAYSCTGHMPLNAVGGFTGWEVINATSQGAGQNGRIGKEIRMLSCMIRFTLYQDAGKNCARFLLVYDKQPQQVMPILATIIQTGTTVAANFEAPVNAVRATNRFIILRDDFIWVQYPRVVPREYYVPLNGLVANWNAANGEADFANFEGGALYAIIIQATLATEDISVDGDLNVGGFQSRVTYLD